MQGQAIELFWSRNPYRTSETQYMQVYPLQPTFRPLTGTLKTISLQSSHSKAFEII
jgi:hypothetical protein